MAGNPTPAFTSTYRYDGLGRRIEKVANGQTKRYIYDDEDILLEYDGSNVLQARYAHGPGIDEPIAVTKGGSTFFYHQDGLGTVTDLTDSTGATAKSYSYDAYGTIVDQTGTVDQPYTYTGREFDSESGLYYYRARSYDPSTGRFIQKDPVGFAGDLNLYRYTRSNSVNRIDPSGMLAPLALIGTGALFGGINGAIGAAVQGGSFQEIAVGAAIGAGVGAAATTIPLLAAVAGSSVAPAYVTALAAELANIAGQLSAGKDCSQLDVGSVIGATIGGSAVGPVRSALREMFEAALPTYPLAANLLAGGLSTAPAVVFPTALSKIGSSIGSTTR